jgi:uncharacterized membrane protein YfcA
MGKVAPDAFMDQAFSWISGSANYYTVCSGSPTAYADARTNFALAGIGITSGCFSVGNGSPDGRSLTIAAKTSASITASGSALAVCLLNTANSTLLYVTTCTQQYLVSGGTVDIPQWVINIADPT